MNKEELALKAIISALSIGLSRLEIALKLSDALEKMRAGDGSAGAELDKLLQEYRQSSQSAKDELTKIIEGN